MKTQLPNATAVEAQTLAATTLTLFIGLDVHNDSIAISIAPSSAEARRAGKTNRRGSQRRAKARSRARRNGDRAEKQKAREEWLAVRRACRAEAPGEGGWFNPGWKGRSGAVTPCFQSIILWRALRSFPIL